MHLDIKQDINYLSIRLLFYKFKYKRLYSKQINSKDRIQNKSNQKYSTVSTNPIYPFLFQCKEFKENQIYEIDQVLLNETAHL